MAKLNIKTFKEALKGSGGNQSVIAEKLKLKSRSTVTMFLNKNPKMRDLLETEAERIIDVSENVLDHDITTNRNVDSAKWKLTNSKRGKARGYGQRQELTLDGNISTSLTKEEIEEEVKRILGK